MPAAIPNRPVGSEKRNVYALLSNFDYLTNLINAGLAAEYFDNQIVSGAKLSDPLRKAGGLHTSRQRTFIATSEATSSASPTDLTTVGPDVSIACDANTVALLFARCDCNNANGQFLFHNVTPGHHVVNLGAGSSEFNGTSSGEHSGRSPGTPDNNQTNAGMDYLPTAQTYTWRMKYYSVSGSVSFSNRELIVFTFKMP
jgi:hypothetical protein